MPLQHCAGESLLTPTVLYVNDMLAVHNSCGLKGAVHITGGGFYENIPRVLPKTLGCVVNSAAWEPLPVFQWLQEAGGLLSSHLVLATVLQRSWQSIQCAMCLAVMS